MLATALADSAAVSVSMAWAARPAVSASGQSPAIKAQRSKPSGESRPPPRDRHSSGAGERGMGGDGTANTSSNNFVRRGAREGGPPW